jgi:hypothetical protein
MSSRRDTYLVPPSHTQQELKPKKLDFLEEQEDAETEFEPNSTSSPNTLNETIIYAQRESASSDSEEEDYTEVDQVESEIDNLANQIVDMTFHHLAGNGTGGTTNQTTHQFYQCETEMISSDSDSDSEDEFDRNASLAMAEIEDLESMIKGFLNRLSVPAPSS